MTENQNNINKMENSGQKWRKLTHWTYIHAGNGISRPGETGMRGRGSMKVGHGG